jgi:hypothetical protein
MPDSLHELQSATTFAGWGRTLWNRWNTIGSVGTRVADRQAYVTRCVRGMLRNINVHPCGVTYSVGADGGSMSRSDWEIDVSSPNFNNNNITLNAFCEILKTAYHEMRHIEQYYRIVQSLCLGINEWRGDEAKKLARTSTGAEVEDRVGVQAAAATHAIGNLNRYDGFAYTQRLGHCVLGSVPGRPNDNWSNTVDEWYLRRFKSDRKVWGQRGLDAQVGTLMDVQFYKRGELDIDTVALEKRLYSQLASRWSNFANLKNAGRQDPAFGG